jgi:membrane fusion protein (multidrug efflux system)
MKNGRKKKQLTRFLALMLAMLLLQACGQKQQQANVAQSEGESPVASVPVEAVAVKRDVIAASYSGTTNLEPENQAQVVAKTSGVLLKLQVEEGDQVHQGQVLARLDAERPRLELARAGANLKRLENDFQRSQNLVASKLISMEAHEKIKFELDTQKAIYNLAQLELSYTNIVAPIDGVISQRLVKEGNLIQLNQNVFRIDDFDPLLAVLNVPERELATLKPGLKVSMSVDALPGQKFEGVIDRVSPVVDAKTGTYTVTSAFRDTTGQLRSGMFGRLDIVYDQRANTLVIPREALIEEDGQNAVFVVDAKPIPVKPLSAEQAKQNPQRAVDASKAPPEFLVKRRSVKIGYIANDQVEIREGLSDAERVVTVGRSAVRDGSKVQILEPSK